MAHVGSCALASAAHAQLPTCGTVESRLGKLEIVNGYPTDATVKKLYDDLDYQRAVQAYLWSLPYTAMGQWQDEQRNKFGAQNLQYVDYFDFKDKLGLLTANATTLYSMVFPDLSKTGPLVFVIPPGAVAGGILDFWQRPLTFKVPAGPTGGIVNDLQMRNITDIRRRLTQKMEFVSEDIAAQAEPSDAELTAYLQAHADAYRVEPRFTFRQVYLNPAKHGEHLARDTTQLLAQLNRAGAQADTSQFGDALLLEHQFSAATARDVGSQFGEQFVAKLTALAPGEWQGPIESSYGIHLVWVSERTEGEGHLPALADVRDEVRRDWQSARRLEANAKFYQELLKRYTVTIEGMEPPVKQPKVAAIETK